MDRTILEHPADRLTDMPIEIIDNILSRISLRDAVRTSVLSREWTHHWKSNHSLVFNSHFDKETLVNHPMSSVLYHVLHLHHGLIHEFSFPTIDSGTCHSLGILMKLLSKVHKFTICFTKMKLSASGELNHLYTFENLVELNLGRCVFSPTEGFGGFKKLKTMSFDQVQFKVEVLISVISQCTLLERVSLVRCSALDQVTVTRPSLRYFSVRGTFGCVHFENSPLLSEVSLSEVSYSMQQDLNYSNHFQLLPTLEKLTMDSSSLQKLNAGASIPYPVGLMSLKVLELTMFLNIFSEIKSALLLAKSSHQLQILKIRLSATGQTTPSADYIEYLQDHDTPDRRLDHIKNVGIEQFSGTESQFEFVKWLLKSAAGLKKIVIQLTVTAPLALVDELLSLPCASSEVQMFCSTGHD